VQDEQRHATEQRRALKASLLGALLGVLLAALARPPRA
jgi:hypothetical protein